MGWVKPKDMGLNDDQINEICERLYSEEMESASKCCHDCGAKPGEAHDVNCDVARCKVCGGQRLQCDCEGGDGDIWTGLWPGVKECYERKLIVFWEGDKHSAINSVKNSYWCFDLNSLIMYK